MKLGFFSRSESQRLTDLVAYGLHLGAEAVVNPSVCDDIDVAVSFGGDGTFLSVARRVGAKNVPILGINNGRMGFLASCPLEGAHKALEAVVKNDFTIEKRTMLEVEGLNQCDPNPTSGVALNEFSIQKQGAAMVNISIGIDDNLPYAFWGDGVIISTPTGSTAYSLSVGGAIVAPQCDCFIISPIAPHNLNLRPLVVNGGSRIMVRVESRDGENSTATLDNEQYVAKSGAQYTIKRSKLELKVIHLPEDSFYKTLRDKLSWAIDPRQ